MSEFNKHEALARAMINMVKRHYSSMNDISASNMASSAKLCLEDAEMFFGHKQYEDVLRPSKKSLEYSIGILHPDYTLIQYALYGFKAIGKSYDEFVNSSSNNSALFHEDENS